MKRCGRRQRRQGRGGQRRGSVDRKLTCAPPWLRVSCARPLGKRREAASGASALRAWQARAGSLIAIIAFAQPGRRFGGTLGLQCRHEKLAPLISVLFPRSTGVWLTFTAQEPLERPPNKRR